MRGGGRDGLQRKLVEVNMRKLEEVREMVILNIVVVSQVYTYTKTDQNLHFKYVQFSILQLYLIRVLIRNKRKEIYNRKINKAKMLLFRKIVNDL